MSVIIIPRKHLTQPQGRVEVATEWAGRLSCAILGGSNFEHVRRVHWTLDPSALITVGQGGKSISAVVEGGYAVWRASPSAVETAKDRYEPAAPPLTVLLIGQEGLTSRRTWFRRNGTGTPAFAVGFDNGSLTAHAAGGVRTTGGEINLGEGLIFDPSTALSASILRIGVATSTLFGGFVGKRPVQVSSAATPSGNFYYEYGGGRNLSLSGRASSKNYLSALIPAEISDEEIFGLFEYPWQLFRADPVRIYSLPSGPISISWSSLTASNITPTTATLTIGGIVR